jgi:hypothetical protein
MAAYGENPVATDTGVHLGTHYGLDFRSTPKLMRRDLRMAVRLHRARMRLGLVCTRARALAAASSAIAPPERIMLCVRRCLPVRERACVRRAC